MTQMLGYKDLSLIRASLLVNCQSMVTSAWFRSLAQALHSTSRHPSSGIRLSKHCLSNTLSSNSAMFNHDPCSGVKCHSILSNTLLAFSGSYVWYKDHIV